MDNANHKRLDIHVHELGFTESRNKARELILNGNVTVNGKMINKPSMIVLNNAEIEIIENFKYVSRAGYKLETAVLAFGLDFTGLTCLDAGAAAGGFTDLMLQKGAKKVYAADVGENQLHQSLRANPRVISMEKQDIRTLILPEKVDFIAADLSFISLKAVIPVFESLLKPDGACAVLIKPQFEAGKRYIKNGVLKDKRLIDKIISDTENFIKEQGYQITGIKEAFPPTLNLGREDKNREFITYFKRSEK
ncbi:MAG: TlyA family RNA methyltransferase [Oscillospiraceae bacterium]|nr:TlyA family RNA methyltransferase [Oscillospiraceae bacterium]